jgi:DNA ligase-1
MAYDLLEIGGEDIRDLSLFNRQKKLEVILKKYSDFLSPIRLSKYMTFENWDQVKKERENTSKKKSEGLMIKRKDSKYEVGRIKGNWWKWKSDPKTIDAVMTYAMRGHGRRTNLFTDYTFALWNNGELVTFAKAYSGLTDKEIKEVDRFVKQNTINRFGPVRQVKPELIFEIAFEGVSLSSRHKSGLSVRFPRILRQRHDKKIEEANSIDDLKKLLL